MRRNFHQSMLQSLLRFRLLHNGCLTTATTTSTSTTATTITTRRGSTMDWMDFFLICSTTLFERHTHAKCLSVVVLSVDNSLLVTAGRYRFFWKSYMPQMKNVQKQSSFGTWYLWGFFILMSAFLSTKNNDLNNLLRHKF